MTQHTAHTTGSALANILTAPISRYASAMRAKTLTVPFLCAGALGFSLPTAGLPICQ